MNQLPWLSLLIAIPLVGGVAALVAGARSASGARRWALSATLAQAVATGYVVAQFVGSGPIVERGPAVLGGASIASLWTLSLDGLALPLVVLTTLLGIIAVLASWKIEERPGGHFALLLALQSAVTAVFIAGNLVLFYVAWEAVLIPMYFLIGVWGHERRRHAAIKFFLFTFAGSALMLAGLLIILFVTGGFAIIGAARPVPVELQPLVFWLLAAGFLVKIPAWPLHTWLPDAHVEAPTAGSIMLAGVLLKMGGYGMLRVAIPSAPVAARSAAWLLAALGAVGIVYGAFMALAQSDLKRLVAYSSVSHMGFVIVAIAVGTQAAIGAAMLGMVSHGLVAGLLFLLVGLLHERTHTREIARFGGLAAQVPAWATAFSFAALASLGLPGLSGFPGELVTVLEGFRPYGWLMVAAAVGVVLAAAYNLYAVRRVSHGPLAEEWSGLRDLTMREAFAVAPLALTILVLGIWPGLVLAFTDPVAGVIAKIAEVGR